MATCLFSIRLFLKSFVLSVKVHTQTISVRSFGPECHTYILVFVWHSGPIDRPLIVFECELFTLEDLGNTFFWDVRNHSLNAERSILEDRNPSKIRGSEVFKSRRVLSDQRCDGFVTTLPIVSSPCEVIRCCFIVWRVQHTREIWRRCVVSRRRWSCSGSGFFVPYVWRVFNKSRFPRSSKLYEKSLQRYL